MSKLRLAGTSEYAMRRAMKLVPLSLIADAVEHSEGYVYKWSDRDSEKKISFEKALIIDDLCFAMVGVAPFYDVLKTNFEMNTMPLTRVPLKETVMQCQVALGGFAARILSATAPNSEGGARVSAMEQQEIMTAIENMRRQLNEAERSVIKARQR